MSWDFTCFCEFLREFADLLEIHSSATARNIRRPVYMYLAVGASMIARSVPLITLVLTNRLSFVLSDAALQFI